MTNFMKAMIDRQIEGIRHIVDKKKDILGNASYEIGLLGPALFYAFYSRYKSDENYLDKSLTLFQEGIGKLNISNFVKYFDTDSLDSHLSNIGRFISYVGKHQFLNLDADDFLTDVDSLVIRLTKMKLESGNFDIHGGAMAGGFYFLTRDINNKEIKSAVLEIVDALENKAIEDTDGDLYWRSPILGNRVYLGISHGSALLISYLTNLYERGIEKDRVIKIITKATRFVLKNSFPYEKGLFPHYIGDDEFGMKQFSLCYGDLGIGYAIYRAGKILNDRRFLDEGMIILADCLHRQMEDKTTIDASLIYGAAGIAETFEKIFNISEDMRFKIASDYWYSKITEYGVNENEFLGYKSRLVNAGDIWNLSFGWGIIGIGISLMRYKDPRLPSLAPLLFIA